MAVPPASWCLSLCLVVTFGLLLPTTHAATDVQGSGKSTGGGAQTGPGIEVVLTPWWPLHFTEGETVSVDCGVYTEGRPQDYSIEWRDAKSQQLNTGQRVNVSRTSGSLLAYSVVTLTVSGLIMSDSQMYTCHAENNVTGSKVQRGIQVTVHTAGERCGFEGGDLCGWHNNENSSLLWIRHHGLDTAIMDRSRGPRYDHTYGPSKHIGHFLDVDLEQQASADPLSRASLVSPRYPASPQAGCLHFWYAMDGTDQDKLVLSLRQEGSPNWTEQLTISQPSGPHWVHQMVDIPPQNGSFWLGFEAHTCTGKCDKAAVALDDIVLESAYCEKTAIQWPDVGLKVRLVDAGSTSQTGPPTQGRVEVLHDGQYGTVCSRQFGNNEAKVVCRALGFENVERAVKVRNSTFGRVSGQLTVWLTHLQCEGGEHDLSLCIGKNQSWGDTGDCTHPEDAGVICVPPTIPDSGSTTGKTTLKIPSTDTSQKTSTTPVSTSSTTEASTRLPTSTPIPTSTPSTTVNSSTTVPTSTTTGTPVPVVSDGKSTSGGSTTPKTSTSQNPSSTTPVPSTTTTTTLSTTPHSSVSKSKPTGSDVTGSSVQPVVVDTDDQNVSMTAGRIGRGVVAGIVLIVVLAIVVLIVLVYKGRKRRLRKSKYLNFGSASYSREHLPTNEFHLESPLTMSSMGYTVLA